jgi:hypothetical protein
MCDQVLSVRALVEILITNARFHQFQPVRPHGQGPRPQPHAPCTQAVPQATPCLPSTSHTCPGALPCAAESPTTQLAVLSHGCTTYQIEKRTPWGNVTGRDMGPERACASGKFERWVDRFQISGPTPTGRSQPCKHQLACGAHERMRHT